MKCCSTSCRSLLSLSSATQEPLSWTLWRLDGWQTVIRLQCFILHAPSDKVSVSTMHWGRPDWVPQRQIDSLVRASRRTGEAGLPRAALTFRLSGSPFTPCKANRHGSKTAPYDGRLPDQRKLAPKPISCSGAFMIVTPKKLKPQCSMPLHWI